MRDETRDYLVDEDAESLRRWEGATCRASGSTDMTAAARLLRLKVDGRSIGPSLRLRREPSEDLWSSWSEITLQSSLEAPGPDPEL